MFRSIGIFALATLSLCCALAQPTPAPTPATPDADALPTGPGKEIVQKACVSCHNVRRVTAKRATKAEWNDTVDQMISRGAALSDSDADILVDYLAANFGPKTDKTTDTPPPPADTSH